MNTSHVTSKPGPIAAGHTAMKRMAQSLQAAALSLLLVVGCATLSPIERDRLLEASRQYSRGDVTAAATTLDQIIRAHDQAAEISEAHYVRGLCRFKMQQLQAASEDFERGISTSKRSDLTARCRASLAAIAYQGGDWKRAAELYGQAVGELPDVPPTDAALFAAGVSMQRAGEWQSASLQFARILQKFRSRPIAADARRMAAWRHPYFSIQLGAYRDADNAGKAVESLRQEGFDAVQEYMPRDGQTAWVVTAGHYQTYLEAAATLVHVRRRHASAAIIP